MTAKHTAGETEAQDGIPATGIESNFRNLKQAGGERSLYGIFDRLPTANLAARVIASDSSGLSLRVHKNSIAALHNLRTKWVAHRSQPREVLQ